MAELLSREAILKSDDRTYQDVKCPEWGGTVRIKSLTGTERDSFEESILGQKGKDGNREVISKNLKVKLIALCAVDKEGNLLFSPDDVAILGEKNAKPLDRLFNVARKLNGIAESDVEEMVKNLEAGQGAGLPTDLPNTLGE